MKQGISPGGFCCCSNSYRIFVSLSEAFSVSDILILLTNHLLRTEALEFLHLQKDRQMMVSKPQESCPHMFLPCIIEDVSCFLEQVRLPYPLVFPGSISRRRILYQRLWPSQRISYLLIFSLFSLTPFSAVLQRMSPSVINF